MKATLQKLQVKLSIAQAAHISSVDSDSDVSSNSDSSSSFSNYSSNDEEKMVRNFLKSRHKKKLNKTEKRSTKTVKQHKDKNLKACVFELWLSASCSLMSFIAHFHLSVVVNMNNNNEKIDD